MNGTAGKVIYPNGAYKDNLKQNHHDKRGGLMSKEALVVVSKVKEYIKAKGCQTSADAIDAINKKVSVLLDGAIERVKANGRATVKPYDL